MRRNSQKRIRLSLDSSDSSSISLLSGVENLFDAAIVLQSPYSLRWRHTGKIRYPLKIKTLLPSSILAPDMELIVKEGRELKHYKASGETGDGAGELLGRAYRLPDGRVVYVPTEKNVVGTRRTINNRADQSNDGYLPHSFFARRNSSDADFSRLFTVSCRDAKTRCERAA